MPAILMSLYAMAAYSFFLAVFLWLVGFVGDLSLLPTTVDLGRASPLGEATLVDLVLIALFGIQHSVMARPGFKRWITRVVPEPIERSTYVLAASLVLAFVMWQWRPIATPLVWHVEQRAGAFVLDALFWIGWALVLLSTYLINHFELFGLRQVWANLRGRQVPVPEFVTPLFYKHTRHPLYLGFVIAFWATPRMSAGHFLFAAACTVYILIGISFEERDLIAQLGDRYRAYREQVSMLLPMPRRNARRDHANGRAR